MTGIKDGLGGGTGLAEDIRHEITNGMIVRADNKLYFRDSGLFVHSDADGQLVISSDGVGANAIKLNGNTNISGAIALTGNVTLTGNSTVTGSLTVSGGNISMVGNTTLKLGSGDTFQVTDQDDFPMARFTEAGDLLLKGGVKRI